MGSSGRQAGTACIPSSEYAGRRARALEALGDGVLLLGSGSSPADPRARFHASSDFSYLTGFAEPDAAMVLRGGAGASFVMFVRDRDPQREAWDGPRPGPEGAKLQLGADEAFPIGKLAEELPRLIDGAPRLYFAPWSSARLDGAVRRALAGLRAQERAGTRAPAALVDPGSVVHELRLRKSAAEIALIERAAEISALGHRAGLSRCRRGTSEYHVQAAIEREFLEHGADGPSYRSIVGAGANGCVLHYVDNRSPIDDGDLVLVDAGATYAGYAADITRTWPASGRFTPAQRDLYDAVLAAEQSGLDAARPGATVEGVHERVVRVLVDGMLSLGLVRGSREEVVESGEYKRYFMHRTSHWLGLEVHDAGAYRVDGASRALEPGMVLTVEPGIYVPPQDDAAPAELKGQAVRIEDDVVIETGGSRVLTRDVPVEPERLAALVGQQARA